MLRERKPSKEVKEGGERNWCHYDDGGEERREKEEGGERNWCHYDDGGGRGKRDLEERKRRERQAYCSVCKFVP